MSQRSLNLAPTNAKKKHNPFEYYIFIVRNFFAAFAYATAFSSLYISYLHATFAYAHFRLLNTDTITSTISLIVSSVPAMFFPLASTPSKYLAAFLYVFIYVPTIITFQFTLRETETQLLILQLLFMFSMIIIFRAAGIKFKAQVVDAFSKFPFVILHLYAGFLAIFCIFQYWGHMKLVGFDSVYELRFANNKLELNAFTGYAIMWLSGCIGPLYFSAGIIKKRFIYACGGLLFCTLVFSCTGSKSPLLLPILIAGMHILIRYTNSRTFFRAFCFCFALLAMLFISIPNPAESNSIIKWSASLLFMRSIGNAGLMNSLYYEFFSKNPQTNFSHLNVVNYFFDSYPYGNLSLGQIIGVHYYKSDSMNANANFWATDGFASSGPTGVLFISVVLSLFFVSVNYFTRNTKTEYTAIYLLPVAVVMTDISFFTTLTSGGGLLLLLFVSFFKIPKS